MKSLLFFFVFCISINTSAALLVNCQTSNKEISAQLQFEKENVNVYVSKHKAMVFTHSGHATHDNKWDSVTVHAVQPQTGNGVKIYFEVAESRRAAIRPYGSTAENLFPGQEGIIVYGMDCDQPYSAIKREIIF